MWPPPNVINPERAFNPKTRVCGRTFWGAISLCPPAPATATTSTTTTTFAANHAAASPP